MTEPTQAQIKEAKQLRAKFAFRGSLDVYTNELASLIAHVRREARNAALEKAAKVFRDCNLWDIFTGVAEEMVLAFKDQL